MKTPQQPKQHNSRKEFLKYAGMGSQILAGLALAVFLGYKSDHWLRLVFPVFIWLLPVFFLAIIFYRIYKDTSKK